MNTEHNPEPPHGFTIITEGSTESGDLFWSSADRWIPVDFDGEDVGQYAAIARNLPAESPSVTESEEASSIAKQAEVGQWMLEVAKANGFECLTDAIVEATKAKSLRAELNAALAERDEARKAAAQNEYCRKALLARISVEEENAIKAERDQLRAEVERLKGKLTELGVKHDVACQTISQMQAERAQRKAHQVLSSISSFVGSGLGDEKTSAEDFDKRIREGIAELVRAPMDELLTLRANAEELAKAVEALDSGITLDAVANLQKALTAFRAQNTQQA